MLFCCKIARKTLDIKIMRKKTNLAEKLTRKTTIFMAHERGSKVRHVL